MIQKRLVVKGERVQGVNYRETACVIARRMHIKGITKNLDDGTVEILCECEDQKHLDEFIGKLIIKGKYENDPVVEKVIVTDDKVTRELGYFNIDYGTDEDLQKELLIKIAVRNNSIKEMRRIKDLDEKTKDDIIFAIKTEKAYQEIKKGKCKTLPLEEFLKEFTK